MMSHIQKPEYLPEILWSSHQLYQSDGNDQCIATSTRLLLSHDSEQLINLLRRKAWGKDTWRKWHMTAIAAAVNLSNFDSIEAKAKRYRALMDGVAEQASQLSKLLTEAEEMWDEQGMDIPPPLLGLRIPALEGYFGIDPEWIPYRHEESTEREREYLDLVAQFPLPHEIVAEIGDSAAIAAQGNDAVFINPIADRLSRCRARSPLPRYIDTFDGYWESQANLNENSVSHEAMRIQAGLVLGSGGVTKEAVIKARQRQRRG